jgi:hypothetical protein
MHATGRLGNGLLATMPEVTLERISASPAICAECLALCSEIVTEELGAAPPLS